MLILGTGYSTDLLLIFSFLLLLLLIFYLTSYKFLRKILFLFDPELIHKISFRFLKIIFWLGKKAINEIADNQKRTIIFSPVLRERLGHHIHGEVWANNIKSVLFILLCRTFPKTGSSC